MCAGDDRNCPEFERHRQKLLDDLDTERRHFLKSAFAATGGAAALTGGGVSLVSPAAGQTAAARQGQPKHHYVPATDTTVHWGYFSKLLKPVVEIDPGDYVSIETLTHHANDDAERMVKGDPGAESVYLWTKDKKGVNRRGAGPLDGKLLGRGAGEGLGVHICTGPIYVRNAEPGDVLELRIMDVKPRPCANPAYAGKSFGSNAAAWWGFQQGADDRSEAARGDHDLRDRCYWTAQLGEGRVQFSVDPADGPIRGGAQDHRLSGCPCRP
jgi:Acetamidase/Formamidase family